MQLRLALAVVRDIPTANSALYNEEKRLQLELKSRSCLLGYNHSTVTTIVFASLYLEKKQVRLSELENF